MNAGASATWPPSAGDARQTRPRKHESSSKAGTQTDPPMAGPRCQRSVEVADYTDVSLGDSVLGEVTSEWSQLEQVSKHPPDVEERLGPDNSQPIDEPLFRDRFHVLTLGVAQMIEA